MDAVAIADFVEPKQHDCCLTISQPLLKSLAGLLPRQPTTVLSIGSGTGLLEALLLQFAGESLDLLGVEVSPRINKYLPEENMLYVNGTWDMSEEATKAGAWMFVYPREPRLLSRYIQSSANPELSKIIWLGPKMDWQDYEPVFAASQYRSITILQGAADYELMAVAESLKHA